MVLLADPAHQVMAQTFEVISATGAILGVRAEDPEEVAAAGVMTVETELEI